MTVGGADRQIYLHWWQGRKKSSAKPCPASGLGQAGLRGNPGQLAPPRAGHISVCCPWPCSEFSDGTKASAAPDSHTPTSACGGERAEEKRQEEREQRREQRAAAGVHTGWEIRDSQSGCDSSYTGLLRGLLMRQAGSAPSHLSLASRGDRGGRSVYRSSSVCDFILRLLNIGTVL